MKKLALFSLFAFIGIYAKSYAQSRIPVFELHVSGNHPLENEPKDRTFYGGGLGVNLVFMDDRVLSFKTGLEANFFHTWNKSAYVGKMASSTNVHYNYWNLSIPALFRLNVGQKVKFFIEAGGYLGIPLAGSSTSKYYLTPMSPGVVNVPEMRKEQYEGHMSVSAAAALGGIFPVSQRVDLILKPEFLFRKNIRIQDSPVSDFNNRFSYFRLCFGMRINLNQELE